MRFMRTSILLLLLPVSLSVSAQDSSKTAIDTSKNMVIANGKIFTKVEIESYYPGGNGGWATFLRANLQYPKKAIRKRIQGTVVVQFIVDKEGNVSDVQAISGPEDGGLREEALRVIKISGRWIPAVQDGRKVKSYKKQPFVFRFE